MAAVMPAPSFDRASSSPNTTTIRALPTPPSPVLSRQQSPSISSSFPLRGPLPTQPQPPRRSNTAPTYLDPPNAQFSSSSSGSRPRSSSPSAPSPSLPSSATGSQLGHQHSPSIPRLPVAHLPSPAPAASGYPSFTGGAPFTGVNAGHGGNGTLQQYPFIPSPHPNGPQGAQAQAAYAMQQAHFQQQQWQLEMAMRNHHLQQQQHQQFAQGLIQQQANASSSRRRATSGPAPAHHQNSQQYYPRSPPYPPSFPTHPQHAHSFSNSSSSSITSTTPQNQILLQHGYLTPPGSDQGRERERERDMREKDAGGYHPYRRDASPSSGTAPKLALQPLTPPLGLSISQFPPITSSASAKSNAPAPSPNGSSRSLPRVTPPSIYADGGVRPRTPSSEKNSPTVATSTATVGMIRPLPIPASTSSTSAQNLAPFVSGAARPRTDSSHSRAGSAPSVASRQRTESTPTNCYAYPSSQQQPQPQQAPYHHPHVRTESQTSFNSTLSSSSRERPRTHSNSSNESRSATPTNHHLNGKRPSPLGKTGAVDDEDSDDTAEANYEGHTAASSLTAAASGKGKEKENKASTSRWKKAFNIGSGSGASSPEIKVDGKGAMVRRGSISTDEQDTAASIRPMGTKLGGEGPRGGKKFGLLNGKLNSSTDNISISSTVSSASVMIRKLGQMGKIARRNSLMGLTKAFKSKDKSSTNEDDGKSRAAVANVSHVTAEVESGTQGGMSPAAALVKKHQEQYAAQEKEAAEKREKTRAKTTDDVVEGGLAKSRMLEKEKERLKSRKGRKWGFGSSSVSSSPAPIVIEQNQNESGGRLENEDDDRVTDGDATPRGSLEVLNAGAAGRYPTYGTGDYFDQGTSDSPQPVDENEFEGYIGSAPKVRRDLKAVRGILKGAGSYNQEDFAARPPLRNRANSFDSPAQQGRPGSPGNAALVGKIPSQAQVDGLVPSSTSTRTDTNPPSSPAASSSATQSTLALDASPTFPYTLPTLNASAPVLAHVPSFSIHPIRSASTPGGSGRRIAFAPNLSVHTTWPASVYDRRAEPATCNRLTPTLAQRIKEELNSFKMEEMEVHPTSRQLTHFFV